MSSKKQIALVENTLQEFLKRHYAENVETATNAQLYYALSNISKELMFEKKAKVVNEKNKNKKTIHYMSIEFLIGKNLRNALWNLEIDDSVREVLAKYKKNIDEVYAFEKDPALGNGGLGRLAACYFDSLAKLGYPSMGHSILYEFGLFHQKIIEGKQIESPDDWMSTGNVWLEPREDLAVDVMIGGQVDQHYSGRGLSYYYSNTTIIRAVPYDMFFCARGSDTTSTLRLWKAENKEKLDLRKFNAGEFPEALKKDNEIEAINKILYPADHYDGGKKLRLVQQYFLVSAAMQNIVSNYFKTHTSLSGLPNAISVHINDTHPALCVPELMRILMDKYGFGWDETWDAVTKIVSYTNHTILTEALEVKSMNMIESTMPRIAMILREIDRRFREKLAEVYKNDTRKIESMAVISGNNVYMANLSICASHYVNGVSKIHSYILKTKLFSNYAEIFENKFKNITNGVTHRRWLSQCNPELDELIKSLIGEGFYDNPMELEKLKNFEKNQSVLKKLASIKFDNKKRLAAYIKKTQGIDIDPNARFDIQVKRIHEYKRQLLNVLKIIYICNRIKFVPDEFVTPQVFIFSGKAAAGYAMAKRIIKLINQLSIEVNNDPLLSSKIKVVFVENYNVSVAELLMPATEVSEQISLAGREASGTGNMKAVLNGGLMLCTKDGANIEIADVCGHENMFEFGLTSEDVEKVKARGYNAMDYYIQSEKVRSVIDKLNVGIAGESFTDIVDYLLGHSDYKDSYMCLADFDSYIDAHYKMDKEYQDRELWNRKSLHSIASMGYFSSDRAIEEYAKKIWNLKKNEQ